MLDINALKQHADLQPLKENFVERNLMASGPFSVAFPFCKGSKDSSSASSSFEQMESTPIKGYFYDARNKQVVFSRTRYITDAPIKFYIYILIIGTDHMEGTENGNPINFNRRLTPIPDAVRPRRN